MQVGLCQTPRGIFGLLEPGGVQLDVGAPLVSLSGIPVGLPVTQQQQSHAWADS